MVTKEQAYERILGKDFGIREEHDIESNYVYTCIYDKKASDKPVYIRTMVLSEEDSACWISAAIRYEVQRLIAAHHIKDGSYIMDRLADLESIAAELEKNA